MDSSIEDCDLSSIKDCDLSIEDLVTQLETRLHEVSNHGWLADKLIGLLSRVNLTPFATNISSNTLLVLGIEGSKADLKLSTIQVSCSTQDIFHLDLSFFARLTINYVSILIQ